MNQEPRNPFGESFPIGPGDFDTGDLPPSAGETPVQSPMLDESEMPPIVIPHPKDRWTE